MYSLFQKVVHRWHVPIHVHAGSPNVHRGWGLPLPTDGLLLMLGNVTPLGVLLPGTDTGEGGALPILGAHKISFHQTHNQGLKVSRTFRGPETSAHSVVSFIFCSNRSST